MAKGLNGGCVLARGYTARAQTPLLVLAAPAIALGSCALGYGRGAREKGVDLGPGLSQAARNGYAEGYEDGLRAERL